MSNVRKMQEMMEEKEICKCGHPKSRHRTMSSGGGKEHIVCIEFMCTCSNFVLDRIIK